MKNTILAMAAASALGMAAFSPAVAAQPIALESDVKVARTIQDEAGDRQVLVAPVDVVPGDRLVFETRYANNGGATVENFVVTNPLPAAVQLAEEDASFAVSVDGGKTYAASVAALTVSDAQTGGRAAELSDVTHIRWTIARIDAGQEGKVSYQAIVR